LTNTREEAENRFAWQRNDEIGLIILQPPFSAARFAAETAVAYLWAELFNSAIPQEEIYGINFRHMLILVPAVIALGKNQESPRNLVNY
jgi:hypothetical protein